MASVKYVKISETRYRKLIAMDRKDAVNCMKGQAPLTWLYKGVINCRACEEKGKFYIEYVIGD